MAGKFSQTYIRFSGFYACRIATHVALELLGLSGSVRGSPGMNVPIVTQSGKADGWDSFLVRLSGTGAGTGLVKVGQRSPRDLARTALHHPQRRHQARARYHHYQARLRTAPT
jgi:hypothetical protein